MSAAKRRIKRKIAQLVRMDDTRSRMQEAPLWQWCTTADRRQTFWNACMKPLAAKLDRAGQKDRALAVLNARVAWRVYTGGNP